LLFYLNAIVGLLLLGQHLPSRASAIEGVVRITLFAGLSWLAFLKVILNVVGGWGGRGVRFGSIDKDADKVEDGVEHVLVLLNLLSFQQFDVEDLEILVEVDNPAVVVFLYILQVVEQKLQLRQLLLLAFLPHPNHLVLLQQHSRKCVQRYLYKMAITGPGIKGRCSSSTSSI
jgi:hypothetical protein